MTFVFQLRIVDTVLLFHCFGDETAISALSSEPLEGLAVCRGRGNTLFFIYFYFFKNLSIGSVSGLEHETFRSAK